MNLFDPSSADVLPEFVAFPDGHEEPEPRGFPREPLQIKGLDLHLFENRKNHGTLDYKTKDLVIRRGHPFELMIKFDRNVSEHDTFQLQFRIGAHPTGLRKTLISLIFEGLSVSGDWEAEAYQDQGMVVKVKVTPTKDAIVGEYMAVVGVHHRNGIRYSAEKHRHRMYILFNAYLSGDVAYLGEQSNFGEYVMNDTGIIYTGDYQNFTGQTWEYGQFEQDILEACIFIMDKSDMPIPDRGDAVKVCRMASAMINSQDDMGVLVGNWSNDFSLGTPPTMWAGSVEILQTYYRTNRPVSYAQCWVFAGVLNTFLRCLGLAARVITNFSSAHDNNGDLRTELVLNEDMQLDTRHSRESIWNFHCWNEVFLNRKDIDEKYGGWQVIDSTPQETSDGHYRCGPASVSAIKIGQVCLPFDARFIFAEVNSDVLYYKRDKYGKRLFVGTDKKLVGKKIVTKRPYVNGYLDLTHDYKYNEDTEQHLNEAALAKAESFGCTRDHTEVPETPLIIKIHTEKGYVGRPVEALVEFENKSSSPLHVPIKITVQSTYYTGVPETKVLVEKEGLTIPPNSTTKREVSVPFYKYQSALRYQTSLQIIVVAKLPGDNFVTESRVISLEVLWLTLEVPPRVTINQVAMATVSFENSLGTDLVNPVVIVQGTGLIRRQQKSFRTIIPGGELRWEVAFNPQRTGTRYLTAIMYTANQFMAGNSVAVTVQSD